MEKYNITFEESGIIQSNLAKADNAGAVRAWFEENKPSAKIIAIKVAESCDEKPGKPCLEILPYSEKRVFSFGKVDYYGRGRKVNEITVEIEYKTKKDGKKEFTACGDIWNATKTDCVCGGQCLDTIARFKGKNPIFKEIYRLWKLYHLNGMHPECEHQEAMGWREIARENVQMYSFTLKDAIINRQREIKNRIFTAAKNCGAYQTDKEEAEILSLDYSGKSWEFSNPYILRFYDRDDKRTETKALGWLKPSEHPKGLLCKPCPICGYKYGSAWLHRDIPTEDETAIYKLLGGAENED